MISYHFLFVKKYCLSCFPLQDEEAREEAAADAREAVDTVPDADAAADATDAGPPLWKSRTRLRKKTAQPLVARPVDQ